MVKLINKMHIDRTKYTAHYENGILVSQWISVDMALDGESGESAKEALDKSRSFVEQWYKDNGQPFPGSFAPVESKVIPVTRTSEDVRVAELIRDIYACTELEGDNGLLTFNKLATTCKEAQQAFDIMFGKLSGHSNSPF
jgi:hypothetical protein